MDATSAALPSAATDTAQLAKAALRRLAVDKLEPTPENYARAWRQEAGGSRTADSNHCGAYFFHHILQYTRACIGWRLRLRCPDDDSQRPPR